VKPVIADKEGGVFTSLIMKLIFVPEAIEEVALTIDMSKVSTLLTYE
jgi:hypothetical protein